MKKFETTPVYILGYTELEDLLKDLYGGNFCVILESSNDVSYYYKEIANDPVEDWYDYIDIQERIINGERNFEHWYIPSILKLLVVEKCIPEGNWLVRVSW